MTLGFWKAERIAGSLLASSLILMVLSLVVMFASGAAAGFRAMTGGSLAEVAPYAATFRLLIFLFIVSWVVHFLGFALFARLLAQAGQEQLAILALSLVVVAVLAATLHFGFRMTVELWAAQEAAQVGSLPTWYEPLRSWTSAIFRFGYGIHLLAMIGTGWGILRTGLLGPGLGWATIGLSLLWLAGILVGAGAPAIPLLMPAVIGIALLLK